MTPLVQQGDAWVRAKLVQAAEPFEPWTIWECGHCCHEIRVRPGQYNTNCPHCFHWNLAPFGAGALRRGPE